MSGRNVQKPQAGRQRSTRDVRVQQILDAALEEFGKNGFAAARLEDIAARLGITRANVYLYYDGKEALFEAVVRRWLEPSVAMIESVATGQGAAWHALLHLLDRVYRELAEPQPRQILKIVVAEGRRFPALLELYQNLVLERGLSAIIRLLKRGVDAGEFSPEVLNAPAQIVLSPTFTAAIWLTMFDARQPLDLVALKTAHVTMLSRWLLISPPRGERNRA